MGLAWLRTVENWTEFDRDEDVTLKDESETGWKSYTTALRRRMRLRKQVGMLRHPSAAGGRIPELRVGPLLA